MVVGYVKFAQFIVQCVWDACFFIGQVCFGLLALFWIAGWLAMGPIMLIGAYMDGEINVWAFIAVEIYFVVPALMWGCVEFWKYYYVFSEEYDERKQP